MISQAEAQELHEALGAAIEAGDTSGLVRARELAALVLGDVMAAAEAQEIILFLPEPGREYGPPEATGPFALGFAEDHLTSHMTVGDGWDAQVIKLDNPNT